MSERAGRVTRRLRETVGRYRPGPSYSGTGIWTPMPAGTEPTTDLQVDAEVNDLSRIVEERGIITRQRLFKELNARYWGPGRFHTALHQALAQGRIKRVRRGLYAKPSLDI